MELRMTVVRVDGSAVDLLVRAPEGAPVRDLRTAVAEAADTGATELRVAGRSFADPLVVGTPPLLHGAVLTAHDVRPGTRPSPVPGRGAAVVELRVVGGPDAGGVHRLALGQHRVGRAADCEVRIRDPAVSRVHCLLEVATGVVLRDSLSCNGTPTGGGDPADPASDGRARPIGPVGQSGRAARSIDVGDRFRVGDSTLELHPVGDDPASLRRGGAGRLELNRPPRPRSEPPPTVVDLPAEPTRPGPPRIPWLAAVLPLVVSVPLALWWGPTALLLGLGGPVLVLGTAWHERRCQASEHATAVARHSRELAAARSALAAAARQEERARRDAAPDPAVIGAVGRHRGRRTWERGRDDPDTLRLRLGTANRPGTTAGRTTGRSEPAAVLLTDVPVCVALPAVGVLGVAGPAAYREALLRWLVAQLAVLHSPRDVRLVMVAPDVPGWDWTGWLPHTALPGGCRARVAADRSQAVRRIGELAALVRERAATRDVAATGGWPWVVLVLDDARALAGVPGLAEVLTRGPAVRVLTVCADSSPAALPPGCHCVAALTDGRDGVRLELRGGRDAPDAHGERVPEVVPDLVAPSWAHVVARGLAPLVDATPGELVTAALPRETDLVTLLRQDGVDPLDPACLAAAWRRRPRSTRAVLGATALGTWAPDLRTAGPHVLVGGTTGSGKSLLLQALVLSLAVVNTPADMAFVLIDFKGGAAFGECARLPHCAGLVTDLDAHLTARALTSLRAELRRRERVLAASGAADLDAHQRVVDAGRGEPLGRLMIVVDEYRALAEELPDLLGSLVRLAAVGRSLGIHLVLATQRPAGVVGPDVRANVNLRIALRVRDPADSEDVVGSPAAAGLDPACPGRALARVGGEDVVAVQVARVGTSPDAPTRPVVQPLAWEQLGDPAPLPSPGPATVLPRLVDALAHAAELAGTQQATSPWLPPLPHRLPAPSPAATGGADVRRADGPPVLTLGMLDVPEQQAQPPLRWELGRRGSVLVAGASRSGRTGALRAVAAAAAVHLPDRVHLQVLDGGGGLADLAELPHTGSVIGRGDPARATRLLERLLDHAARRAQADQHPWALLLVDALDQLWPDLDAHDGGRGTDLLLQLLRAGPGTGVLSVLTGDRSLLGGRLAGLAGERWLLRPGDPSDLLLAGVPARSAPAHQPPGRLLRVTGTEVHEAQLFHVTSADVLAAARLPQPRPAPDRRPLQVAALPGHVSMADLLAASGGPARTDGPDGPLLLGIGGRDAEPAGLDLRGRAALVAGPPGSGRSTALRAAARSALHRGDRVLLLLPDRGTPRQQQPPAPAAGLTMLDGSDPAALRAALTDAALVLVDDLARLQDGDAEQALLTALDAAPRTGAGLLVAGATTDLAHRFGGLAAAARRSHCGLLLTPTTPADGDLFGVTLPRTSEGPPGRGYLIRHGAVDRIQIADCR